MIEKKISFDPTQPEDRREILRMLCDWSGIDYKSISDASSHSAVKTSNQSIKDEREAKITELSSEITKLESQIKKYEDSDKEKYEEIKKQSQKINEAEQNRLEALEKLGEIESKYASDIESKDIEIQKLKGLLSNYDIAYASDDPGNKIYFKVQDDSTLDETKTKDYALYFACKKGEAYVYSINEGVPMNDAFKDIDKNIRPFCEIEENMGGANYIKLEKAGNARIIGSKLIIIDKVKVSLIKQ